MVKTNTILDTSFHSGSVEATRQWAAQWAAGLSWGTVIGLSGDLGAGKTCFAKGLIAQLTGTPADEIPSPTFTLVEEYEGAGKVYHVDLYRVESMKETEELPVEDWFAPDAITLIEWPERLPELMTDCHYLLKFNKEGASERLIEIERIKS